MIDIPMICRAIASIAMAGAIGTAVYKTENPNCLWALFFIAAIW